MSFGLDFIFTLRQYARTMLSRISQSTWNGLLGDQSDLIYVWDQSTWEGRGIILALLALSMFAWSVMIYKGAQMRRARRLNHAFEEEFANQTDVLDIHRRRVDVTGCPLFNIYEAAGSTLVERLETARRRQIKQSQPPSTPSGRLTPEHVMEHIQRALDRAVARESVGLESGLILLAIAVSGAPFMGLLGTVWGVMVAFSQAGIAGKAQLEVLAPGVAAALSTTVAGLLVAIPSMFGYNWLVHTLRILTVEMDNFAQELASRIDIEYREGEIALPGQEDTPAAPAPAQEEIQYNPTEESNPTHDPAPPTNNESPPDKPSSNPEA